MPEDFKVLLEANVQANLAYNKLSYSHKKEYVTWIHSAMKKETRAKRRE
ncbi:YdeI/OmpD-associated family protein [Paenibacillus sp. Soil787]